MLKFRSQQQILTKKIEDVCVIWLWKLQRETNLCKQVDLSANNLDRERRRFVYGRKALIFKFCNEVIFVNGVQNDMALF